MPLIVNEYRVAEVACFEWEGCEQGGFSILLHIDVPHLWHHNLLSIVKIQLSFGELCQILVGAVDILGPGMLVSCLNF